MTAPDQPADGPKSAEPHLCQRCATWIYPGDKHECPMPKSAEAAVDALLREAESFEKRLRTAFTPCEFDHVKIAAKELSAESLTGQGLRIADVLLGITAAIRQRQQEQGAGVQGWKLVPVKLDKQMQRAAYFESDDHNQALWDQLLAAAPQPPAVKP